jgi:acyl carrier protein
MTATPEVLNGVRNLLAHTLQLGDRARKLDAETGLLGNLAELDSMAVVTVLAAIEDHFGIVVADDDVSADTFATLGSLAEFVQAKLTC